MLETNIVIHSLADTLSQISVPFNPIKLVLLIGWVYLCMYFVQRVQFSGLVPEKYKPAANTLTLFVGPFLLLTLMTIEILQKTRTGEENFITATSGTFRRSLGKFKANRHSEIDIYDSSGRSLTDIYGQGKKPKQENRTLKFTEQIILDALRERSSDILIDPKQKSVHRIRFRVDGVLRTVNELDANTCQAVINSIKAVSNMDIAERRRPQDGAFVAEVDDATISFRVSSAGVLNGEKLSIRILNKDAGQFTLSTIGLSTKQQKIVKKAIDKPLGMILMCGPTGSGKTTSLYAMLNEIDLFARNVITVEDPIEYVLPDASQIEVNPKAGINFASSLRSVLRQDPDVIVVGEIRDEETASIALRAAQTGHLVLATVHSRSNASSLVRLLDLGVSPIMLSAGLNLLVSQRLLRRLCPECKARAELSSSQIKYFHKKKINYTNICQPVGCDKCGQTGYYGRIGIFDALPIDEKLKEKIGHDKDFGTKMKDYGDKKGKSNLTKQAIRYVVSGETSMKELKRVIG